MEGDQSVVKNVRRKTCDALKSSLYNRMVMAEIYTVGRTLTATQLTMIRPGFVRITPDHSGRPLWNSGLPYHIT
jgi:hypothetical protein